MKLTDPCGFCNRTLRLGDSFHEVTVLEGEHGGRAPGRYNNVCGECAGFEVVVPVVVDGQPKDKTQRCGLCKRAMTHGTSYQRLRTVEADGFEFEVGLHAMCNDCYGQHKGVVHARTGGKDF